MKIFTIISVIAAWWTIGVASFIYWWTTDHDFRQSEIPWALFFGIIGPFTFIIGWMIHGDPITSEVLVKKRR